jgi:hypothetical protein
MGGLQAPDRGGIPRCTNVGLCLASSQLPAAPPTRPYPLKYDAEVRDGAHTATQWLMMFER